MIRYLSAACLICSLVCPALAVFAFEEPETRNIWAGSFSIGPPKQLSTQRLDGVKKEGSKPNLQGVISESDSRNISAERLAGDFIGGDFLLGPVSFMRLGAVVDAVSDSDVIEFDLNCYDLGLGYICPSEPECDKIRISRTPVPSAVLLALVGVAGVGWLRRRLTIR